MPSGAAPLEPAMVPATVSMLPATGLVGVTVCTGIGKFALCAGAHFTYRVVLKGGMVTANIEV